MTLTKRQQELRKLRIGASEIAVLAGLSRWSSPIELFEVKTGQRKAADSYAVDLGVELEAPIARIWARRNGRYLAAVDSLTVREFAVATPDRAVYLTASARGDGRTLKTDVRDAEKLLQVKSTNWRLSHLWGEENTDSIPDEYVCQAHWEGAVAGQSVVEFAVDVDKTALRQYRVEVDLDIFEGLYELAERFMRDHVIPLRPPPVDASEKYSEFLSRAYPRHGAGRTGDDLLLVPDGDPLLADLEVYAKGKVAEKRLEAVMKLARNRIVDRIGAATGLAGSWGKLTYKATKGSRKTDWEAVAKSHELVAALALNSMPEGDAKAELSRRLAHAVEEHTSMSAGYRRLHTAIHGWQFEAGPVTLQLEAEEAKSLTSSTTKEGTNV